MPKKLPKNWVRGEKNSLNVLIDLGIKCPVSNLFIYRGSKNKGLTLLCRWLPDEEEDLRPENKKRTKGGKRKYFEGSTGCIDPFEAGKVAVDWYKRVRKGMEDDARIQEFAEGKSLHSYWEQFFTSFEKEFINKRGGQKRITNTKTYWYGEEIGIMHQPFSVKSVEKINYNDLEEYWRVIDKRGEKYGRNMAETKKQIKTLLNKLIKVAIRSGLYPNLRQLEYPPIHSGEKKTAVYFTQKMWENLLLQVDIFSGGNAIKNQNSKEFEETEWTEKNRKNPRNFVEVYDALLMMWFFYLRAEDMPRIKVEWFSIRKDSNGDENAVLNLEQAKGFRGLKESFAFRPDAVESVKRMKERRKNCEYLVFDFYKRPKNNESGSQVLETLNELLKYACENCYYKKNFEKIKDDIRWTTIRHTAFMETCREFDDLRNPSLLASFADNAYTSAKTLRENYLNKIDRESTALKGRKTLKKGRYTTK